MLAVISVFDFFVSQVRTHHTHYPAHSHIPTQKQHDPQPCGITELQVQEEENGECTVRMVLDIGKGLEASQIMTFVMWFGVDAAVQEWSTFISLIGVTGWLSV